MDTQHVNFRTLFNSILAYRGWTLYWHVLVPWLEMHAAEKCWIQAISERRGSPIPAVSTEESWELYALSRCFDLMTLNIRRGCVPGSNRSKTSISAEELAQFASSLGLTCIDQPEYSPFYHEIVEVEQDIDDSCPVVLLSTFWPCLMLGEMMLIRSGVTIGAGRTHVRKEIVETSRLYWAWQRWNRPTMDLSHGWGSNSQWRTHFRRDYRIGSTLYFNVEGGNDLTDPESTRTDSNPLSRDMRIELLINRCFVKSPEPTGDLWPYDDTFRLME